MKILQNNFTTLEQSKRLLELGVPADSADCYLNGNFVIILNGKTFQENYNEDLELARLHLIEYPHYVPCWSVGRLIEIYLICNEVIDNVTELHHSAIKIDVREFHIVEYIISKLTNKVKKNKGFFSKLEE